MTEAPLWIRPAVSPGEREVSKCCDNCQSADNYSEGSISVGYLEKSRITSAKLNNTHAWNKKCRKPVDFMKLTHKSNMEARDLFDQRRTNWNGAWLAHKKVECRWCFNVKNGFLLDLEDGRKPHSNCTPEIEVRIIVCRNFASFEVLLCPSIVHGNFPRSAIVVKTSLSVWKGLLHRRFRSATRYWEKK